MTNAIDTFDPNAVGQLNLGIFGLPFTTDQSTVVILPVPWEVTTSYGGGTAKGPESVFNASFQVDLYHPDFPNAWRSGVAMVDPNPEWEATSNALKPLAQAIIDRQANGNPVDDPDSQRLIQQLNAASTKLATTVQQSTLQWMEAGKIVGLLGGDHSTPLGFYQALAVKYPNFGILHIDAHLDLRDAYEGFQQSHASIMHNALNIPELTQITHVGIRDYCESEQQLIEANPHRLSLFTDRAIKRALYQGDTWSAICDRIIDTLPQHVHISFDIDGLIPALCPNTGTPVPGGLELEAVEFLIQKLVLRGKRIIGFDLVEVSPNETEWDANVGARVLYMLFGYTVLAAQ